MRIGYLKSCRRLLLGMMLVFSLCVVAGAASIGIPILKDFDRRGTAHVTRCEIFYEKEAALSGIATFGFLFLFVIAGSP
jgi:hypothetical protein